MRKGEIWGSTLGDRIREFMKRFCGPRHYPSGWEQWTTRKQYDYRRL